jgi:cytidylate kinase
MKNTTLHHYPYRNLTISGLPGSGSTTLLAMMKEELHLDGWRGFSGGEFMRAYAAEKGLFDSSKKQHHDSTHYEDEFDRQVDMGMRDKLKTEEHWILESWLSGFMAQQVPGVLKVLMICSVDSVRIDRIVNRDEISVGEAKKHLHERYQNNLLKWQRMYGELWQEFVVKPGTRAATDPIDFWHPDLYDVVIDTYSHNKEETLQIVLHALEKKT